MIIIILAWCLSNSLRSAVLSLFWLLSLFYCVSCLTHLFTSMYWFHFYASLNQLCAIIMVSIYIYMIFDSCKGRWMFVSFILIQFHDNSIINYINVSLKCLVVCKVFPMGVKNSNNSLIVVHMSVNIVILSCYINNFEVN